MEDLVELNSYRIERRIGSGGMATVYKAYQTSMDRYVALKIMSQEIASDAAAVSRFEVEAKIIGNLQHPYILPVYDFGKAKGYYYLAMRLVETGSLHDLIRKNGRFDLPQATAIVKQVGGAIDYAHKKGVIHRDFKPANVLIDEFGNCLLTDFGIAKLMEATTHLTVKGQIMGTPTYLSPEQASGERKTDHRSDIYSLGVVIYQMLTGDVPFRADSSLGVLYKHIHETPPPPREILPELPESLEKVIMKALAKNPDERYTTAGELVTAFETALRPSLSLGAAETKKKGKAAKTTKARPKWLIPVIVAVLLVIGIGIYGVTQMGRLSGGGDYMALVKAGVVEAAGKNTKGADEFKHQKDKALMVLIPAGEFTMGSSQYSYEQPVQKVTTNSYFIDKYPVTNKQFDQFVKETKHVTDAEKNGFGNVLQGRHWRKVKGATWRKPDGIESIDGKESHPVRQVSHNDATAYCKWADKDLPTEAQWEKAARGPQGYKYPWGDSDPNDTLANYDNFTGMTTPVEQFEKGQSFYGCFDMAGNTYEWCRDWYATYSEGKREDIDPKGPDKGSEHVVKGGCYVEGMESLRSAHRDRFDPNYSSNLISFRTVCKPLAKK
ncbi:MAG: hypothetical protein C4576_06480 [Desulfobacteraceae bacterium]|nr:MAG: hypothetical protein C4576_06480 [Desulfobacteraceae bacterium]